MKTKRTVSDEGVISSFFVRVWLPLDNQLSKNSVGDYPLSLSGIITMRLAKL